MIVRLLHWFFCKINDPIWSPSRFGACCWCGKVHGKSSPARDAHVELGKIGESLAEEIRKYDDF